jgi:hypothetical protein
MRIEIPFEVHGADNEVEARETIINSLVSVGLFRMNGLLEAEGSKIRLSLPKTKWKDIMARNRKLPKVLNVRWDGAGDDKWMHAEAEIENLAMDDGETVEVGIYELKRIVTARKRVEVLFVSKKWLSTA